MNFVNFVTIPTDGVAHVSGLNASIDSNGYPVPVEDSVRLLMGATFEGLLSMAGNKIRLDYSGGVVAVSDRQVTGSIVQGRFGPQELGDQPGSQAAVWSYPIEIINSIALHYKKRLLGGPTPTAMTLYVTDPSALAGIRMEILGDTTYDRRGSKVHDLEARFDEIVKLIAQNLIAGSGDGEAPHLHALLAGQRVREDGDLVAVFVSG